MNVASAAPERPHTAWLKRHAIKIAVAVGVVIIASYFVLGPYLTLMKLRNGVKERNAEAIVECIDFPALRQNLKEQLQRAVSARLGPQSPFAALASAFAVTAADGLVDRAVSPEGLAGLMTGQKPALTSQSPSPASAPTSQLLEGATYGYESLGEFVVKVPTQGGNIRFVLTRSGIDWKLSRIEIPTGG